MILLSTVLAGKETGILEIPVFDYVTGRFEPEKHPDFEYIAKNEIDAPRNIMLRRETITALKKMLAGLKKDHPSIKVFIISGTRNFDTQKRIWDGKWDGRRKVAGQKDILNIKDPVKRALIILEYSSMPGTSRHHWGTDFDLNSLNNAYFEKGTGKILYNWLDSNAHKYGFAQPYTANRENGYMEEKWHWSYVPLAKVYLKQWNRCFKETPGKFKTEGKFKGSEQSIQLAPVYVNSINPECK